MMENCVYRQQMSRSARHDDSLLRRRRGTGRLCRIAVMSRVTGLTSKILCSRIDFSEPEEEEFHIDNASEGSPERLDFGIKGFSGSIGCAIDKEV